VANPPELAPSYFNIDVFLVGFFPEFFISDYCRRPNCTDVPEAPINEKIVFFFESQS
jgi:hypothetical protein